MGKFLETLTHLFGKEIKSGNEKSNQERLNVIRVNDPIECDTFRSAKLPFLLENQLFAESMR